MRNKEQMLSVPRELVERINRMYLDGMSVFGECEELRALLAQPAAQHQGAPTPISDDMHQLLEAYRLGEFDCEGGSNTVEALSVAAFDSVESHGHDDDSYMAGFCAALYTQAAPFIWLALQPARDLGEVERLRNELGEAKGEYDRSTNNVTALRAQLVERDAALNTMTDIANGYKRDLDERDVLLNRQPSFINALEKFEAEDGTFVRLSDVFGAISASAEPANDLCADGAHEFVIFHPGCTKCGAPYSAEPSAPVERDERAAIELAAQAVYESWSDKPGYVPWQPGGNSERQGDARLIARRTAAKHGNG